MINAEMFANPVVFLISYDEIIKDPNLFILNKLRLKLREQMKRYISIDDLIIKSQAALKKDLLIRNKKNILEYFSLVEFDYEANYKAMYDKYLDLYIDNPPMAVADVIKNIQDQGFVKDIYIYSKIFDKRKLFDIKGLFGDTERITYVTGNYLDAVDRIGQVDVFIDNDLDRISPLFGDEVYKEKLFILAKYGYNYIIEKNNLVLKDKMQEVINKNRIQLTEFTPFRLTQECFFNG